MNKLKPVWIIFISLVTLTSLSSNVRAQSDIFITQPQLPPTINTPALSIEQQMLQRNGSSIPRSTSIRRHIVKVTPKLKGALQKCNNAYISGYLGMSLRDPNRYIPPQVLQRARQCGAI
ncbi:MULTISPECIES: hypothetical protein [Nostocales]|uniref:Uncharacterized protein n=1 Tax=Tolypothrix campylonemoides VB511288_2 TaxID=3232311 RepID=A0ABW8XMH0_9CYAN